MSDLRFCGSQFFSYNLTWNASDPKVTNCFEKTVIWWTPAIVLLLASSIEVRTYWQSKGRNIPWNLYNLSKVVATGAIILINLVDLILVATNASYLNAFAVDHVANVVNLLGSLLSLIMLHLSRKYGVHTSPAQFFYFLTSIICGALILANQVDWSPGTPFYADLILFTVQYGIKVILCALNLFSDVQPQELAPEVKHSDNACPKSGASFASKLTFAWITGLLWTGMKRPLKQDDLWQMDPNLSSEEVCFEFDQNVSSSSTSPKEAAGGDLVVDKPASSRRRVSVLLPLVKTFCYSIGFRAANRLRVDMVRTPAVFLCSLDFVLRVK